jgi:RND family efflux transporter MFP subunit
MLPVVGCLILAGVLLVGWLPRVERAQAVERQNRRVMAPRRVVTAVVELGPAKRSMTLHGTAAPVKSAIVTSRNVGFVQQLLVDLGDTVKRGQVLAVLEAPEVDEDSRRARARLTEAEANLELGQSATERVARLAEQGVASRQAAEEAQSRLSTAVATVASARAEVQRLSAVKGYSRVVAPFDGVITRRFVELGSLAASDRAPLFEVAQIGQLKIAIDVPQWMAADVSVGQEVKVVTAPRTSSAVIAHVTRTSGALDPSTRTLRAEVVIEANRTLLPNAFVEVSFSVERSERSMVVPSSAVVARADGPRVYVAKNGTVTAASVVVARDLGRSVELNSGVEVGDRLVVNPPADLEPGEAVEVVFPDGGTLR